MPDEAIDPESPRPEPDADDSEGHGAGEDNPPTPAHAARSQRRRLEKVSREELVERHFIVGQDPSKVEVRFSGGRVGRHYADAEWIGNAIRSFVRVLQRLEPGAPILLTNFQFGNSVDITLEPPTDEVRDGQRRVAQAVDLEQEDRGDEAATFRTASIPGIIVAANMAGQLFNTRTEDVVAETRSYGTGVAAALRTFATTLSEGEATIRVEAAKVDTGRLNPDKAGVIAERLKAAASEQTVTITVAGLLSIADATQRGFGLKVDRELVGDQPLLKGKRMIRGNYTAEAGDKVRDLGLWGREVVASISVTFDPALSSATVRPPSYVLVDVQARYE